jgi:hypothetical protein
MAASTASIDRQETWFCQSTTAGWPAAPPPKAVLGGGWSAKAKYSTSISVVAVDAIIGPAIIVAIFMARAKCADLTKV